MAILFKITLLFQVLFGYISAKGVQCITKKNWLGVVMVFLSIACPFAFTAKWSPLEYNSFIELICDFGNFYLGFVLYFSIFCVLVFIISKFKKNLNLPKVLSIGLIGVLIILAAGYFNAITPRLKKITINGSSENLKICFVSDMHLGCINTHRINKRVAKLIKKAEPDVVILGGDIVDLKSIENYGDDLVKILKNVTSKYKTYAVIGNHEFYAGANECIQLLRKSGVEMLLDNFVEFGNITIAGRLDRVVGDRLPLNKIIPPNTKNLIVVDHSPDFLSESIRNNAFLHLSGHTHGGQIFPINMLVYLMYGETGKLKKIENTFCYITYGAGFWGPPYRIGSSSEVVLIKLKKDS